MNMTLKAQDYYNLASKKGIEWLGDPKTGTPKARDKTTWRCQNGHIFKANKRDVQNSQSNGCKECYDNKRRKGIKSKKEEDYNLLANKTGLIWIGSSPKRIKDLTSWQCNCGNEFQKSYLSVYKNLSNNSVACPDCNMYTSKTDKDYHNLASENLIKWVGKRPKSVDDKTKWQCAKGHKWKATFSHIKNGTSCPICNESRGEIAIRKILTEKNIVFISQKKFSGCKQKRELPFDFYLPKINILIEFNGEQHYKPVKFFGGRKNLKEVQLRDKIKADWAAANGITLLIIPYTEFDRIEEILSAYI